MTASGPILSRLGLAQYIDGFIDEGFETWETVLDITESDLDALGVKLGHRRRLQREIANARGVSVEKTPIPPIRASSLEEGRYRGAEGNPYENTTEGKPLSGASGKRKYRRHPKPDENAPDRPPSAYVIFSNKIREDLKPRNLSFTEIAKLVGESWQILSPELKEPYETQASAAKEKYHTELAKYKKTDQYREYTEYLAEFKLKNASNAGTRNRNGKRPKLEKQFSASSESAGSQHDLVSSFSGNTVRNRHRVGSVGSIGTRSTPSGHPSPRDLAIAAPTAMVGGVSTLLGASTPASHSPSSSSASYKENFQNSPRFQSHTEIIDQGAANSEGLHLPRIMSLDSRNGRVTTTTASISNDLTMARGHNSPLAGMRRSNRIVPASLFQHDTLSSNQSSRSSNLSGEDTAPSSIYGPVDDPRSQRSLPSLSTVGLKPIANAESGAQVHVYPSHSPFGSSSSGTLESLQLPLPYNISFQNDRPPPRDPLANSDCVAEDIPHERKSLQNLALTGTSPSPGQDLRSPLRNLPEAPPPQHPPVLQTGSIFDAERFHNAHQTPGERLPKPHPTPLERYSRPHLRNDDYEAESFPVSHSDPLSVLAYAGRIVDRDARSRSPKH